MEFGILGPLAIREGGRELDLSGNRRRAVLARLLLSANSIVDVDVLVEDTWGRQPPAAARSTLQSHVSEIRKVVGTDRVRARTGGYVIEVAAEELDAQVFETEMRAGIDALAAGRPDEAARRLETAVACWRGPLLSDIDGPWVVAAATRLDELRVAALEARVDARLALGEHAQLVGEMTRLVHEYPLRERLWEQRMLVLYRSGRQADALRAFQEVRDLLGDDLGLEPGPGLVALERAILAHDPELALRAPVSAPAARPDALPSGIVTFLLSDVVGSTRMWEQESAAMSAALERHDALFEAAVHGAGGRLLKARGEGDSTFSVFTRASDAAAAATAVAHAIATGPWPTSTPLVVRMAIHSGETIERNDDYYGRTVNRAARLRAVAGPGQILVSQATAELVVDQLPPGTHLVELGPTVLRDLARPEVVFALGSGTAPVLPLASEPVTGSEPATVPVPVQLEAASGPALVGRDTVLAALADAFDSAAGGVATTRLVCGEPGIGKTIVLAATARAAAERGATVLFGRCDEAVDLPYQAVSEAVTHLVRHAPTALLREHVGVYGGEIARICPALRERLVAPDPTSRDPESDRAALFRAVAGLLTAAARADPILLVLDDLHWADIATIALIRHLATADPASRVLVLLGARNDSSPRVAELRTFVTRERSAAEIALAPLDIDAVTRLVADHFPNADRARVDELAARLQPDTDGNPFFVVELLRHLEESSVEPGEFGGLGLPSTVREVVEQRVDRLGNDVGRLLATAAVIGQEFDLEVLARTAQIDEDHALDLLDIAVSSSLVRELSGPLDRFAFAHALAQQTLVEGLGPARLRRLHAHATRALVEIVGDRPDDRIFELAHHAIAAAHPDDRSDALRYAHLAGDHALRRLVPEQAELWYRRARELLEATPASGDDEHDRRACELAIGTGTALRQLGRPDHREVLLEAAATAQRIGASDLLVAAALANFRGFAASHYGRDLERIAVLEAALDAIGNRDGAERSRLLATLASELEVEGDGADAARLAAESLAIARRLDDEPTLLYALCHPGTGWRADALPHRLALAYEAVTLAERLDDPLAGFIASSQLFAAAFAGADIDQVDTCVARIADYAQHYPEPTMKWFAAGFGGLRALLAGDLDEADRLSNLAFSIGVENGEPDAAVFYASLSGGIRITQGRAAELLPMMEGLMQQPAQEKSFTAVVAFCLMESGETARARALLDDAARDGFASLPRDGSFVVTLALWARVAHETDHLEAATFLRELLTPFHDQFGMTAGSVTGCNAQHLAVLCATLGDDAAADAYFEQAHATLTRMRARYFLALMLQLRGRWRLRRSVDPDPMAGRSDLETARDLAAAGGYGAVQLECNALLDTRRPTEETNR